MSDKKINTSWGNVADWYEDVVADDNSYQQKVILPNLIRLMDIKKGESVLDIGCGTGFFSRAFAEVGATVTGVDLGKELIAIAEKANRRDSSTAVGMTVTYHVASSDAMPFVKKNSIDKAVMVLSLQNMENAAGAISEAARTLKDGGQLFVVLNHPAFRIPGASEWGWDPEKPIGLGASAKKGLQYRRLDSYMSERKVPIQMHPGSDPKDVTWSFHRPLQWYFKLFAKHHLAVFRLEEWVSHTKTPTGPRAAAENRARAEFPVFLCLVVGT